MLANDENKSELAQLSSDSKGEIILYQPDSYLKLEVRLEEETVWLSQAQMAELFQTTIPNVNIHLKNIFEERELEEVATIKDFLIVRQEGKRMVQRSISCYNLDVIISAGYRIKSQRGTRFRQWATHVLKDFLLKGYVVNQRIDRLERKMVEHDQKFDLLINTSSPQKEGVFYDGQIFDAYVFAADLIKSAKKSVILIDNYVDEVTLLLLSKRKTKVSATIYTKKISTQLQLDLEKHNEQYAPVSIAKNSNFHDRFLLIDGSVYHIGASLKDLGKKLFAFSKMETKAADILQGL